MSELRYQPYSAEHKMEVVALLQSTFGNSFTQELFEWKHEKNPAGKSLGWLALDDHGVVGCNFFLKTDFTLAGGVRQLLRSCESAVHERGRRRGIFSTLIESAQKAYQHDGYLGFFGTPNSQSSSGFKKLGWQFLPPVRNHYFFNFGFLRFGGEPVSFMPASEFPREWVFTPASSFGIHKNQPYFQWRYQKVVGDYTLAFNSGAGEVSFIIYKAIKKKSVSVVIPYEWVGPPNVLTRILGEIMKRERTPFLFANQNYAAHAVGGVKYFSGDTEFIYSPFQSSLRFDGLTVTMGDLDKVL